MKKSIQSTILGFLLVIFLSVGAYGVENFSISPTQFSETLGTQENSVSSLIVTNTGNETLNISISTTGLLGPSSISVSLGTTLIENLAPLASSNVAFSYLTGTTEGSYSGTITADSGALSKDLELNVTVSDTGLEYIFIDDEDDTIAITELKFETEEGKKDKVSFYIKNTGTVDLTDLKLEITESEDEIDDGNFEIEINNKKDDEIDELDIGDVSKKIEITFEKNNVKTGRYDATLEVTTDEGLDKELDLEVRIKSSNDEDLFVDENNLDVRNGVLELVGEAGEKEDGFEFTLVNEGSTDLEDIIFELDGNLEEEFSSATLPTSAITFDPITIDVNEDDEEDIEVILDVPEGQETGTYFGELDIFDSEGDKLDSIQVKVRVIGDIFIDDLVLETSVIPGSDLDVEVTVNNKGSQVVRNVRVLGTLFNVDIGNSDIHESSTTFLLDINDKQTESLRFRIPDEAADGSHTLEIRVIYDGEELTEVETITIERPTNKLDVESYSINPSFPKCEDTLLAFMKVTNLGKFDEDVKITAEVQGTGIKGESSTQELEVDNTMQRSITLDIESLEPGKYSVIHKAVFGSSSVTKESSLTVVECKDSSVGLDIEDDLNDTVNKTSDNTLQVFGSDVEKSSVYLGAGLGGVLILIVVGLFLL